MTSSQTADVQAAFAGLTANTTYYLRARAAGFGGSLSAFTATVSTFTTSPALLPVSAAGVSAGATTLDFSWANGGNAAGTSYRALLSTAANFTGTGASSDTLNLTTGFTGLAANTTYYFKVKSLGGLGPDSAYTAALTSATLPNAPLAAAVSAVTAGSETLGWGANANPAGTLYAAQLSTASNFSGTLTSSATFGTSAAFAALTANTTYYLRVKALGHGGSESAFAVAAASATDANAPTVPAILASSTRSAQLGWNANANPSGTLYAAQLSTGSNFGGTVTSSQTADLQALFAGLAGNTTYYLRVRASGFGGSLSAFSATASTFTTSPALLPLSAAVASVNAAAMDFIWASGGNLGATPYRALLSTTSAFTGGGDASSDTLNAAATFSGLSANTTYYFKLKALGGLGPDSAFTATLASATWPNAPVTGAVSAVTAGSETLGWAANANPAGTLYAAQLSTASNFSGTLASSATTGTSATFASLAANTTYYLRVRALGHGGTESAYAVATASATDANAVAAASVTLSASDSVRLGWTANANPAGTLYSAQLSTAADFGGTLASSRTLGTQADFSALTANTTYYLRIQALGHGGSPSAYQVAPASATLPALPASSAANAVTTSTLQLGWAANGNPAGTLYSAQVAATADFAAPLASSRTVASTALFTGLTPNATYTLRVRALGHSGALSSYAVASASATEPNVPAAPAVQTVGGTGLRLLWESAANAEGSRYDATLSTASNFSGTLVSSQTTALHATFNALTANTTYYLRVRTAGFGGTASAFGATVSSFTTVGAAMPSPPAATLAAATALTVAWTDGINAAGTRYRALLSTAPGFAGGADASSDTSNLSAVFSGLSVNATYYFKVKALGGAGPDSAYTSATASSTLANAPLTAAVSAVTATTSRLDWAVNGNPAGTPFLAELSAASDFSGTPASSRTFGSSALFSALTPNATYYLRVRALGHGGALTAFSVAGASATDVNAPLSAAVSAVTPTTAQLAWGTNANPAGTLYLAQLSTAAGFGGTLASSRTFSAQAGFTGLTANTTYYLRVLAQGHGGSESAYAVAAASATEANAPTAAVVLAASGTSVQLGWGANANPSGTLYSAQLSTSSGFAAPVTSSRTAGLQALFADLGANATYYLRVRAEGVGGALSGFSATVSTFTTSAALSPVSAAVVSAAASSLSTQWGNGGNPAGTPYRALLSTSPAFAGAGDGSSDTLNTSAVFTGLSANTTYYFKVKALGGLGPDSAFTAALASATLPNAPVTAAVTAVTTSTAQLGWGGNANPGGTLYAAQVAATADFASPLSSSRTFATTASFTGLTPNATYYLRVRAVGHGGFLSDYAVAAASATDANVPTGAAVQTVGGTGLRLLWDAAGNAEGSRYDANLSTASNFTGTLASSRTAALFATFNGLTANTTYYLRVRTLGFGGTATAFGAASSSFTTVGAAMPSPAAATLSATTALTIAWTDGINNAGTQYRALLSTAPGFGGGADASSDTLNLSAVFSGLSVNATYYFKVKALGGAGPDSAYTSATASSTLANAPLTAAASAVTPTSMRLDWGLNANPAGTPFLAELSAASDFSGTPASSRTFGSSALFSGFTPNATYYLRVRALGHGGALTAFSVAAASATRPNAPSSLSAVDRAGTSIRWTWDANGDAVGTVFSAELAADVAFTGTVVSSVTFNAEATFTGLTTNTTYYLRARALGRDGAFTAYGATAVGVTQTGGPSSPAAFSASTESLTFVWSANGNPAGTRFRAEVSTSTGFLGAVSSVTVAQEAFFPGLAVNTTHYFRVKAVGNDGTDSAFTGTVSSTTLAAAPTGTALMSGADTALQARWSAGANPVGTRYLLERSAAQDFSSSLVSSATAAAEAEFGSLVPNTTYYLRAKAIGHGGTHTGYDAVLVAVTSAAVPGTPSFSGAGLSTVTVSWTRSSNPVDTAYRVQVSPADDFSGTPAERVTTDASAQFTGLSEHTTYYARVRAVDRAGRA
ncbi:MAG: psrP, partial [Elusimicrobia bacterium]